MSLTKIAKTYTAMNGKKQSNNIPILRENDVSRTRIALDESRHLNDGLLQRIEDLRRYSGLQRLDLVLLPGDVELLQRCWVNNCRDINTKHCYKL